MLESATINADSAGNPPAWRTHLAVHYNTLHYITIQYHTIQYNTSRIKTSLRHKPTSLPPTQRYFPPSVHPLQNPLTSAACSPCLRIM